MSRSLRALIAVAGCALTACDSPTDGPAGGEPAPEEPLDEETRRRLRALGYLD